MSGFNTETEICPVGLNLWNLLLAEPETLSTRKGHHSGEGSRIIPSDSPTPPTTDGPVLFGQLSHGTTLSFFGAARAKDVMGTWKLQNPARAFDRIKSYLQAEMQRAEWEILDDTEFDEILHGEEAVMIRGQQHANETNPARVAMGQTTQNVEASGTRALRRESHGADSESSKVTTGSTKTPGANGWTKVRNRNSEVGQAL
jgi:hypothetical protein